VEIKKNIIRNILLSEEVTFSNEKGNKQKSQIEYEFQSWKTSSKVTFNPSNNWRSFLKFEIGKNNRTGDNFLYFLPEKRDGVFFEISTNFNYQMNSFTKLNFDYSSEKYPEEKMEHTLSVELVAEF